MCLGNFKFSEIKKCKRVSCIRLFLQNVIAYLIKKNTYNAKLF